MKKDNFNYELCAKCNGKCCYTMPGTYSPDDFEDKITVEFLLSLLNTGKYAIDSWENNPNIYYIRPRIINKPVFHESYGGRCIQHDDKIGCLLPKKDRPLQCKMLIPEITMTECNTSEEYSKKAMAIMWLNYQKEILRAYDLYADKLRNKI